MSLVIESDFIVHVFCKNVEMNTIGDYKILKHVTYRNTLEILTENEHEHRTKAIQSSKYDFYTKIGNVISTIGARRIKQTF